MKTLIIMIIILVVLATLIFAFYKFGGASLDAMKERIGSILGFSQESGIGKI